MPFALRYLTAKFYKTKFFEIDSALNFPDFPRSSGSLQIAEQLVNYKKVSEQLPKKNRIWGFSKQTTFKIV